MCEHRSSRPPGLPQRFWAFLPLLLAALASADARPGGAAEPPRSELLIRPALGDSFDPFESDPVESTPSPSPAFEQSPPGSPVDARSYQNHRLRTTLGEAKLQTQPADAAPRESLQAELAKNPCAAMDEKPLGELGINITESGDEFPNAPAAACWNQLNASAGPIPAARHWGLHVYNWDATCLCHRPLYFEQINLERHGYGCCEPLQPLASAAHFFATVPALPYCMAVECPCECVYTLGHYRPGGCPPLRYHWPPCSPLAAAAEGGVWTGMVFLIP